MNQSRIDVSVVLRTGSLTDGMKWKISVTSGGAYKITPKTGEANHRVLAVGTYLINSDGVDIQQRDYVNDTNYKDEWFVEAVNPFLITLCGIQASGHDHVTALEHCFPILNDAGYNNLHLIDGSLSGTACKEILLSTRAFTSRSHGQAFFYYGETTPAATGILLNEETGDVFYSHYWNNMTNGSQYVRDTDSFTNIDFALFIACETALGDNGANNLPTALVSRGATVAVGFLGLITCSDANNWTKLFYSRLLLGDTVEQAVEYACDNSSKSSGLQSKVICGDGNYCIS